MLYASTRQINFLVPQALSAGTADVLVRTNVGSSGAVSSTVRAVQPGVFFDASTGFGAILVAGTGQVTQVRPASAGEVVEIYGTGLGTTDSNQSTLARPQVTIGGSTAEVLFSGLAPGFPGLYQVNARIPAGLQSGSLPLAVTADGIRSNEVQIQLR